MPISPLVFALNPTYRIGSRSLFTTLLPIFARILELPQVTVAKTFSVSVATIKRYLKQRRERGHVLPKVIPGRPAVKGAVLQPHLRAQLEAYPDVTREEHCLLFEQAHGITVSPASISRARAALGWTRKKRR